MEPAYWHAACRPCSDNEIDTWENSMPMDAAQSAADFDADPAYECTWQNGSASGTFDLGWEGKEETFTFDATAQGRCTVTVKGYNGAGGNYTIRVVAK